MTLSPFVAIQSIRVRLEVETITDGGTATIVDADAGLFVPFNKLFADVVRMHVKARYTGDFPLDAIWEFDDIANPTGFTAWIYRTDTGVKVTGEFVWDAAGF